HGVASVCRLDHRVPVALERRGGSAADDLLVVHHEHHAAARQRGGSFHRGRRLPKTRIALHGRQLDLECTAASGPAQYFDATVMAPYDALYGSQAKTAARKFRGEERIEDL